MYPTSEPPEQPEQETSFAPDAICCWEDSASGVVSLGPALQVPDERLGIQFTWFFYSHQNFEREWWEGESTIEAVVPEMVIGSQT